MKNGQLKLAGKQSRRRCVTAPGVVELFFESQPVAFRCDLGQQDFVYKSGLKNFHKFNRFY